MGNSQFKDINERSFRDGNLIINYKTQINNYFPNSIITIKIINNQFRLSCGGKIQINYDFDHIEEFIIEKTSGVCCLYINEQVKKYIESIALTKSKLLVVTFHDRDEPKVFNLDDLNFSVEFLQDIDEATYDRMENESTSRNRSIEEMKDNNPLDITLQVG